MGKKRVIEKAGAAGAAGEKAVKVQKSRITSGILYIQSTYNNTLLTLTDIKGNSVAWATSGSSGFKGAKKGTPFAASKVAGLLIDKAKIAGLMEVDIIVKGVGAGRESAIRAVAGKGIKINSIKDITPVPHNGPKAKKPRRV